MKLVGDMAIKNLTPPGANIGHRIIKNMRICGSGIYTYHKSELPLFGLDMSKAPADLPVMVNMYRPPEVLVEHKDMFARIPIITGRHIAVTPDNAKQLTVGMVGDTVQSEVDPKDGETYLYTTGTIVAGDGIDMYEHYGQLSVGYTPTAVWESGTHNGVPYQAKLIDYQDVNHLLLCQQARGGPQCMVMDSIDSLSPLERMIAKLQGGQKMSVFTKIFGNNKKTVAGDSRVPVLLKSIAVGADPAIQVKQVREITSNKLAGDAQTVFNGYLDELAGCKDEAPEMKSKAVDIVCDFYQKSVAGDEEPAKDEPKKDESKKDELAKDESKKDEPKKDESKKDELAKDGSKKDESKKDESKKPAGDEDPIANFNSRMELIEKEVHQLTAMLTKEPTPNGAFTTQVAGDSVNAKKTSDDIMSQLYGGK